jgi:hypothetical protein
MAGQIGPITIVQSVGRLAKLDADSRTEAVANIVNPFTGKPAPSSYKAAPCSSIRSSRNIGAHAS